MKRISKIMVACDFSEYSIEALKYAAELAEDLKSDLIIVNVINERDVISIRMVSNVSSAIPEEKFLKDKMERRLERINELIEEISPSHLPVKKVF